MLPEIERRTIMSCWDDSALDAGYRGDEARQVARIAEEEARELAERTNTGAVYIYGTSDDLIEIEGSCPGCDEYSAFGADRESFLFIGPTGKTRVQVSYVTPGVWSIAVAPVGEDVPMLPVSFQPIRQGHSARALVQGVEMVVHEAKPAS